MFCAHFLSDDGAKENSLQYEEISDDEDLDAILNKATTDTEEEKKRQSNHFLSCFVSVMHPKYGLLSKSL